MAQFSSFPSARARGIDAAAIQNQVQSAQDSQNRNALVQSRIQGEQADQERLTATDEQARARRGVELGVRYLEVALLGETPEKQQRLYQEGKRRYGIDGYDISKLPDTFNPEQAREYIAVGKAQLAGSGKPTTPLDIERMLKLAGIDPQSEQGQAIIVRNLQGSGKNLTATERDVPFIARIFGITEKEALKLKLFAGEMSYDEFLQALILRTASSYGADRAVEYARKAADDLYGRNPEPPASTPPKKDSGFIKWLQDAIGAITGDDEKPAELKAAPKAKSVPKAKAAKKGTYEDPHMPQTDADFGGIKSRELYIDPDDKQFYRKP